MKFILTALLGILGILSVQITNVQAATFVTPTFSGIGTCPGNPACPSLEPSAVITGGGFPSQSAVTPSTGAPTQLPSENPDDPCLSSEISVASDHKSKHWKHNGGVSGFMEALLEFFLELLNMLLKLFGGSINIPTQPNPQPTPSIAPLPSITNPSITPIDPTSSPCPEPSGSEEPSDAPEPSKVPSSPDPSAEPSVVPSLSVQPSGTTQLPAQVLYLANWKLQLPTGQQGKVDEIKQPALATSRIDPWFVTTPEGNGVRFRSPISGVTTSGSKYPRSELREMTNNGTTNAAWQAGTGTHIMTIDQAITAVPTTKKHVVAGQIHDGNKDIIVVRLEYPKLYINIGGATGPTLDANYTLGKRFTIKFEVSNNQTKMYYNGNTNPVYTMSNTYSTAYFKAGAYTQSNCTTEVTSSLCNANNYGEVVLYNIIVTHK